MCSTLACALVSLATSGGGVFFDLAIMRAMVRHSGMVRRTRPGISRFGVRCFASLRSCRFRRSKTLIMSYYVYIVASRRDGAIYIGVTNNLVRRFYEHRIKAVPGFTSKYNITQLVWFEVYDDPVSAITRERAQEVEKELEDTVDREPEPA